MRLYSLVIAVGLWAGCSGDGTKTDSGASRPDTPDTPLLIDEDADGHDSTTDCDDTEPRVYPGAVELCDGLDNDCNDLIDDGAPDTDMDGICDAFDVEECDGLDNDGDGSVDEDQSDSDKDGTCDALDSEDCDGLDNDGDGSIDEDFLDTDGDGLADCIDGEDCDGLDNNGDGTVDEGYRDTDGDGTADCIDIEECDGLDNDGDGIVDEDFSDTDGDGTADCVDVEECDGLDNDGDGSIDEDFSDTDKDGTADCVDVEECDGLDNDGDGSVDEDQSDADGDGTCDALDAEECDGLDNDGDGSVDEDQSDSDKDGTCDALDTEECDGLDNDGDGSVDEDQSDADGDGTCDALDAEECDGLDNDGDGSIDEDFSDTDGDGTADCVDVEECDGLDNDGDGSIDEDFSDTDKDGTADCIDVEECDGLDNDGDGSIDEEVSEDADEDGYRLCDGDCDDDDDTVYPGATEDFDLKDNDCDGVADEDYIAEGDLVLTEVMIAPVASSDNKGEYFEVYNPGSDDINMLGWTISESGGDGFTVEDDVVVLAGDYVVFARRSTNNGGIPTTDYAYDTALAFSNGTSGDLMLEVDGTVVDEVVWDGGKLWPYLEGTSMSLDIDYYDATLNDSENYWCLSSSTYGDGDVGTPGDDNDLCPAFDHDGDGYSADDGDCDDADPNTYPGATETEPGVDNDCDGLVGNTVPVAVADYLNASTVEVCDTIELDGLGSEDPDGDFIQSYTWTLDGAPSDSSLTTSDIDSPSDASPFFVPDIEGTYTFGLVVSDGTDDSDMDTVDVSVSTRTGSNTAPVADAVADDDSLTEEANCQRIGGVWTCNPCSGSTTGLSAAGSSDADGDALQYTWSTDSSYASFDDDTAETPTVTFSGVPATYGSTNEVTISLTVTVSDCQGDEDSATVDVVFTCDGT